MAADEDEMPRTDALEAISALGEPTRRALYAYVIAQADWVSRDAAAKAVGAARATTAHHLDRLAAEGLLDVDYQRLTGRRGPGAGRPAKLYRRGRREFDVSLPPRSYDLAGHILAEAADRSRTGDADIASAIDQAATDEGRRLAEEIRAEQGTRAPRSTNARRRTVVRALEARGFEPVRLDDGTIVLRNCPFHQLAQQHPALICDMNHCLVSAALDELGDTGLEARLEPQEDSCCVRLHPAG